LKTVARLWMVEVGELGITENAGENGASEGQQNKRSFRTNLQRMNGRQYGCRVHTEIGTPNSVTISRPFH